MAMQKREVRQQEVVVLLVVLVNRCSRTTCCMEPSSKLSCNSWVSQ